ncbi:integrase core domain-containing protein [Micromonospora pisi]|uniref:integrase core domain-containing protein n=1 Tax=Micromonospora pisi TaxID=589240 RepID=UPI001FECFEEA|nr:integrase core domain-containing protein [Micromonospora pisi]
MPRTALNHPRLLIRPETVLRRHLTARRHARHSHPHQLGRPRTVRSIRRLVLRLASENATWGYRRTHGELLVLGVKVAASTIWKILKDAGVDPAPQRTSSTWAAFLRSQAQAVIAADFIETTTLTGARLYVLAVIEHATRRIRILGATTHPTAAWVTQTARNLVMDLEDARRPVKYLIRDRDGKYPTLFDRVPADAGITVVHTGVRTPRMNAIKERWIRTCRRELLDRTLILNQRHLLHPLREYEVFYNEHRPQHFRQVQRRWPVRSSLYVADAMSSRLVMPKQCVDRLPQLDRRARFGATIGYLPADGFGGASSWRLIGWGLVRAPAAAARKSVE